MAYMMTAEESRLCVEQLVSIEQQQLSLEQQMKNKESSVCGYDKTKKKKNSRHDATISGASCSAADPSSALTADAVPSQPSQRIVAPVVGQQRSYSTALGGQYSSPVAAQQTVSPLSPQGLPVAGNACDVAMSAGSSVGGNVAMLIPGRQPLLAVSAVASDVPTLMSQLLLAGASIQNNLMAGAVYGVPSYQCASPLGVPSTLAQPDSSPVHGAFVSQTSDHDERPSNAC